MKQIYQKLWEDHGAVSGPAPEDALHLRNTECGGPSLDGGCIAGQSTYEATYLVGGCPIAVTATYQICIEFGRVIAINVYGLEWSPDDTNDACIELFAEIDNLDPVEQAHALDDLHAQLSQNVERDLASSILSVFVGVDCDGLNTNTNLNFFEVDCRAWCLDATDVGGGGFQLSYTSCGTSCCVRKSEYCYDFTVGELVELSSDVELVSGQCSIPSGEFCLADVDNLCTDPCARLQ